MKFLRSVTSLFAVLGLTVAFTVEAQTRLKIGWTNGTESHYGAGILAFDAEIRKRTNGRFQLELFPMAALGGEREMLEAVQIGTQDMVFTSTGPVGNFVPETRIVDIPFLFRDYDHARKVLDGAIGQEILAKFPAKGLVAISWMENGFRHITDSKRAVKTPEDVKGLKIRTMENKVHMEAFKAMGALPTPMSMNELFTSLQTGTVDGQENPIPVILSNKLYTVQKYLTLTAHVYSPALLITSTTLWNKLSAADKEAFKEAAKVALAANRKKVDEDDANGIATIKAAGVDVTMKVDRAQFKKSVASAYELYAKDFGADKIARISAVQ